MAGPQERYGQQSHTATDIAADDAGVSAAERLANRGGDQPLSDGDRAMAAMASRHNRLAGSAVGVGSVGFDQGGVYTSADGAVGEDEELLMDGRKRSSREPRSSLAGSNTTSAKTVPPFEAGRTAEVRPAHIHTVSAGRSISRSHQ